MSLPIVGQIGASDQAEVVAYLAGLAQEAADARREWEVLADSNLTVYTYGSDPPPDAGVVVVNEIQNAIVAATDIQTKEPPAATLSPVETGEPAPVYWAGPAERGLALGLPAAAAGAWLDEGGTMRTPVPLTEEQVEAMRQRVASGEVREEWLAEINDRTLADVYQAVFDLLWERSRTDLWIRQNLLETNILGWTFGLYEFDDERKRHALRHLSIKQVYIDPTVRDIAEAAYAGVDLAIDAQEAMRLYPHLAGAIERNAHAGSPDRPAGAWGLGQAFDGRDFRRPMVVMRVFWLRHQEMPAGADGRPRRGIRQITAIAESVVDDRECEHWDIPLLHNVNLPIPGKPWGLGEPFRLAAMQDADSRLVTAMVEHSEYYKAPLVTISQSMHDLLPEEYKDSYIRPGMVLVVPDEQWQASGGKVHTVLDPPQTPPALVELHSILKDLIIEESGHTEVLQGRTRAQMSGRAIQELQTAAAAMIGFKSQRTADMVYRLSQLMLHCIVTRMEVEDVGRIVSRYPRPVLAAIRGRARQAQWNVRVLVSSGSGAIVAQKKAEAMRQYQAGAISLRTLREQLGVDYRLEERRTAEEGMGRAAAGSPAGSGAPGSGALKGPRLGSESTSDSTATNAQPGGS